MSFVINENDRKFLLSVARRTVEAKLNNENFVLGDFPESLNFKSGCFVTLNLRKRLRGCIGNFGSDVNIVSNVSNMALAAAFEDFRFMPLEIEDVKNVVFEISVLSPMIPISSVEEVEVGRDGLYVICGRKKGVLLPQVALSYSWDKYEFLSQTCIKAGLSRDAWKTDKVELYRFEAIVFSEEAD